VKIFDPLRAPSLDSATLWLNSLPLGPTQLGGHVVLINFWTYTCINWLRQLPYIRAWSQAYRDDGLVVIGVHTPEFSFEHDVERVRRAVMTLEVDFPVAIDNDYVIWTAFANHYWPALYFIDGDGAMRDFHYGEGRYEQSERVIQKLLGLDREPTSIEAHGLGTPAAWHALRATETYLGYEFGERFASPGRVSPDACRTYQVPDRLRSDHWALSGDWTIHAEYIESANAGASLSYRFHARDAHLVLARRTPDPVPFRVTLDGEPPASSHGLDIDEHGRGVLDESRLYQLIRQHDKVHKRVVTIEFLSGGAESYAFSFG
jgi:thiol-disulfide isomerase/thioredoxin